MYTYSLTFIFQSCLECIIDHLNMNPNTSPIAKQLASMINQVSVILLYCLFFALNPIVIKLNQMIEDVLQ